MTGMLDVSGVNQSGIDTATFISKLMAVAAAPQNQIKSQLAASQAVTAAYTTVKNALGSLATALGTVTTLGSAVSATSAWSATSVTSTSTAVTAASNGTAVPSSTVTFDVTSLARAQVSTAAVGTTAVADPAAGIDVTGADGEVTHLTVADTSPEAVADAINASTVGVRAQVVQTDSGTVLSFTSKTTGATGGFSIAGLTAPVRTTVPPSDASITVGDPAAGGYTITSPTNTFTGVAPGVTFTVSAVATAVTLSVARDTAPASDAVSDAMGALNDALTALTGLTGQNGVLQGDATVRPLVQTLLGAVSDGTAAGDSFARYGIQLGGGSRLPQLGKVYFDKAAFTAAFAGDPAGTAASIGALADRLTRVVDTYTDPVDGVITRATDAAGDQQTSLKDAIDDWSRRLSDQQDRLTAKLSAMNTALARIKSQGDYLTSVFDSLDAAASSSK